MRLFLKKAWEKIKKYWQLFVGLFVGLWFAVRLWWQLRAQKKILANEIETAKKIREAENEFSDKIKSSTEVATRLHDERVKIANEDLSENTIKIKEEFDERIEENNTGSNEDLANKVADTFGVNVVFPEGDTDEE
mgnify:CR=1 FL=1